MPNSDVNSVLLIWYDTLKSQADAWRGREQEEWMLLAAVFDTAADVFRQAAEN